MYIIEPCCAPRHLMLLRNDIGKNGTAEFQGHGDLSFAELLPAIMGRYADTEMMVVAPSLPDQAAEVIGIWMRVQWPRMDGKGRVPAIRHLTIVADLSVWKSPKASQWLKENPWGGRLKLVDTAQEETAILLPDFAITGPVNMRYGNPFTATATTDPDTVAALWAKFASPAEPELPAAKEEPVATEHTDDTEKPEAEEAPKPRKFRKKGANSEGDKPDNSEGVQATPDPS